MEINRKNNFFRTLFILFLSVMLAVNGPVSAGAAQAGRNTGEMENPVYLQYKTVYLPYEDVDKAVKDGWWAFEFEQVAPRVDYDFKIKNGNYIVKSTVRSSNEEVIKSNDLSVWESSDAAKGDFSCHNAGIYGYVSYPGTTDISFQDKYGQEYVVNLVVLPYENPLKSVKITNVKKGKNLADKLIGFREYPQNGGLIFSKNTAKPTVKLKAADGWKITKIDIDCGDDSTWQAVHWNSKGVKSKTIKLKKVRKRDGITVYVKLKNSKTKAEQWIYLGDRERY